MLKEISCILMKWIWTYYLQEINRNAEELITEEEREKKRIEKRKAKKKVPVECDRKLGLHYD